MKPWRDEESKDYSKKKPKRASNRPGEGMRVINAFDDDYNEYYLDLDDDIDVEEYSTKSTNRGK